MITQFSQYRPPHPAEGWVMQVPVIMTAHFPRTDCDLLYQHAIFIEQEDHRSAIIILNELKPEEKAMLAPSTLDLMDHFSSLGYKYLRLDPDGEGIEGIPTFDW